jgi:cystathionine gamma-lyase
MDPESSSLILTHSFEDRARHYGAVTPPVYLNSLHVFPTVEAYTHADLSDDECFVYGRAGKPHHPSSGAQAGGAGGRGAGEGVLFRHGGGHQRDSGHLQGGPITSSACATPTSREAVHGGGGRPPAEHRHLFVTGCDLDEVERAIRPNTRLMILESPATFVFTVVDLRPLPTSAADGRSDLYIDNTYCTPLYQNPLEFGIDIVMHTLSKYLGGHSDMIGGALIARDGDLMDYIIRNMREWLGGVLGPMEGWLVLRGLRSLAARLEAHQQAAMKVAAFLEAQPKVRRLLYTGLKSHPQRDLIARGRCAVHTGLMSLWLDRPPEDAARFANALKLFGKGCSWGGFESLVLCPLYEAPEEELAFLGNLGRGLIRLHCGLEGADNLLAALDRALGEI